MLKTAKCRRKDPTPEIVDHCAARLIAEGKAQNKRQAYAICVAHLQRTGYLKPGTLKLTEKGRRRNAYHLQHPRAIDLKKVASERPRLLPAAAAAGGGLGAAYLIRWAKSRMGLPGLLLAPAVYAAAGAGTSLGLSYLIAPELPLLQRVRAAVTGAAPAILAGPLAWLATWPISKKFASHAAIAAAALSGILFGKKKFHFSLSLQSSEGSLRPQVSIEQE